MVPLLSRALASGITGAVAGAVCLVLTFTADPDLRLEMDRDLPRMTSGFYPAEIAGGSSFAWTARSAVLRMPGADRGVPWTCAVRVRGGRSAPLAQPDVDLAADGITLGTLTVTNEYQTLEVTVPPLPSRSGLVLTLTSSSTFVPGPGDTRELGVQVDQLTCRRGGVGLAIPPQRALAAAAAAGAAFGGAFGVLGTLPAAIAGTVVLAVAQAFPLSRGPAPYNRYAERVPPLALWIAGAVVVAAILLARRRREALPAAARFVIAFSGGALFLQLLALLHPSKLIIDAVFHAHRLDWVLGGRYYFTQPMPDGVQFPYAIGLYLFAAPWSALTQDHVSLLRIVVCASHALAGALLYPMVAGAWQDRRAGASAVVLFHLVPLPYIVIGNANLTYAFGQSAAFVTIAAVTAWALQTRHVVQLAGLFFLAALAFLSHVGVFPLLLTTLGGVAVLYWTAGGPPVRIAGRMVFIAAALAAVFSVVTYYGQFAEVYKSLDRVRGRTAAAAPADGAPAERAVQPGIPMHRRAGTAVMLALRAFGWPVVVLALAGAWQVWKGRRRDRLTLVLAAVGLTYLLFVAFAAWTPVEPRFQKYSDEFIDRVNYATVPLVVILAASAASRAWRSGLAGRIAAGALLGAAALPGLRQWLAWFV